MQTTITLRGVRVHNLKSVDVDIPLGRLTVVTGVSGAGKRSLIFDTLYAEAQRRYVQSFSAYTRQFLERFDKPDADTISDVPPAIAIRRTKSSERVGTLTGIGAQLRLLFARTGTLTCPDCRQPVKAHTRDDVIAILLAMPSGVRATIAFSAVAPELKEQPAWRAALLEEGYVRVQQGTSAFRLDQPGDHAFAAGSSAWILLDRVEIGKTSSERVGESVDAALRRGEGRIGILTDTSEFVFERRPTCPNCGRTFPPLEARLFDAHDPLGACPTCHGSGMVGVEDCSACQGRRFNPIALAVTLGDMSIADWLAQPVSAIRKKTHDLKSTDRALLDAMGAQLDALVELNLGSITLAESAATLSDGARRRIGLASALASSLVNVLYLIDEPTAGLHARDLGKLIAALHRLRERGNTVVVIDHERSLLEVADHVIDVGPGAGEDGGTIVYQGPPAGLATAPESPTSDFWTGRDAIDTPTERRKPSSWLTLDQLRIPLGVLCVTGERRLVLDKLYPALFHAKKKKAESPSLKIDGAHKIADVILLDQESFARSARSNPATLLKIFDAIRDLFAETTDAKIRNFGPGHFSFNQPGGRCDTCEGHGTLTIDMQFLADVTAVCPDCHGRRYRKEILDIKVRSLSIAEVLDLTIREAFRFFRAQPAIEKKLKVLLDVGLEYLRLGQSVETLGGGECQRLKLAAHLASSRKTGCLFILEEPSAGLHPADVANLLACFDRLLSAGHSVLVIDHDADVLRCADWVI